MSAEEPSVAGSGIVDAIAAMSALLAERFYQCVIGECNPEVVLQMRDTMRQQATEAGSCGVVVDWCCNGCTMHLSMLFMNSMCRGRLAWHAFDGKFDGNSMGCD